VTEILAGIAIALTLAGMLVRPRGLSEAWIAGLGGLAMLLTRAVSPRQAVDEVRHSGDVLLFLLGMMILTAATERAGVYEHLAEWCARLARGSGTLLFANVFVLGALVTTLLSLDVMIIVVTPIVYTIAVRRRLDPLPFMFACTFIANTGSLLLPISNLTNLLVYHDAGVSFVAFARTMWLPEIVAVATNYLLFRWIFRRSLPATLPLDVDDPLPATDWWYAVSAIVLAATLAGLFALGLAEKPLSIAALAGAAVILPIGLGGKRVVVREIAREVSWPLFVFVIGMVLVVRGAEETILLRVGTPLPGHPVGALIAAAGISAIGSNVVNNVPMTLLALPFLDDLGGRVRAAAIYGTLAGVNIGPTLTTYGSLATMLWLTAIRKRGMNVSTMLYLRVGVIAMPIILVATVVALLLTTR
jgi:arsenical pump membrane protein